MPTYEIKLQTRWHTLNTLVIRSELVPGTLIYVGIRCHTSEAAEIFVHARNSQRMPTYKLYAANTLEVRWLCALSTLLIRNSYVVIRRYTSVKVRRF